MRFQPIEWESGAFQRPVTAGQVSAMCERAFGHGVSIAAVVELGGVLCNSTLRLSTSSAGAAGRQA